MSAVPFEPGLRVVPPVSTRSRFAWVLTVRAAARRAFDKVLSVPRAAAGYVARLIAAVGQSSLLSSVRSMLGRAASTAASVVGRWGGALSAGVLALGSSTVRGLLGRGLSFIGRGLSWLGRTVAGAVDRGLRWLGKPGARVADGLQAAVRSVGRTVDRVAAWAVGAVARVVVVARGPLTVAAGIVRALSVRSLVNRLISSRVLRLVVQGVLVPLGDGRVVRWLGDLVRTALARVRALLSQREQMAKVTGTPKPASSTATAASSPVGEQASPAAAENLNAAATAERVEAEETAEVPLPEPSNRAERRARDRQRR